MVNERRWHEDDSVNFFHHGGLGYRRYFGYTNRLTIEWDTAGYVGLVDENGDEILGTHLRDAEAAKEKADSLYSVLNSF